MTISGKRTLKTSEDLELDVGMMSNGFIKTLENTSKPTRRFIQELLMLMIVAKNERDVGEHVVIEFGAHVS